MSIEPQARATNMRRRIHVARLYPTAVQAVALDRQGHTARAIWNLLHEWYCWGEGQIAQRPSRGEIDRQLRQGRTNPPSGWEWVSELPAKATQQVVKHYLRAWDRYYKGVSKRPKFKQRNHRMAIDSPQASDLRIRRLNRRWGEITVQMVGRVRFRWTRPLPSGLPDGRGRITGARLIKDTLGWHVCFRIEEPAETVAQNTGPPVGVDRGVVHTMALSDGHYLDMPELLDPGERRRLRKLELQAARRRQARWKEPGTLMSRRENRVYGQLAALRARQARRREDWLHKQTTQLAKNHSLVVLEDLRIHNMTRSARGTSATSGTNVRAKAGLNRSILAMAWGKAGGMLAYKCPAGGGELVKVDPRNSSLTCALCGYLTAANRVGQATFHCQSCGHHANADFNAAQVLLARGLAARSGTAPGYGVAGRGAFANGRALKRQPLVGVLHEPLSGAILASGEEDANT